MIFLHYDVENVKKGDVIDAEKNDEVIVGVRGVRYCDSFVFSHVFFICSGCC